MDHPAIRLSTKRSHYESVRRVILAMHNQLDQPMSTQAMARIAFVSPYHFNRTFRQVTGLPPAQFLYALRLDAAKRLLIHTQKKVIDICYEVGYNSIGTFTRRFTNLQGVSPTRLRELAQAEAQTAEDFPQTAEDFPQAAEDVAPPVPPETAAPAATGRLSGFISAPANFRGLIFIGLFESSLPQAKPVACCVATEAGPYQIENIPQGNFFLFALGLEYPARGTDHLHYASALRAGGHQVSVCGDSVLGGTYISLRPPSVFDPPILLTLPVLMKDMPAETGKAREFARECPVMPLQAPSLAAGEVFSRSARMSA